MRLMRPVIALMVVGMMSGCASLMGEKTQKLSINSTPAKAEISITDETGSVVFEGQTPTSTDLEKSDGSYFGGKTYVVTLKKTGYAPHSVTLNSKVNGWYVAGNLLNIVGWLVIDPMSGAMYTLDPTEVSVNYTINGAKNEEGTLSIVLLEQVPSIYKDKLKAIQ
ncbi:MAG: hypothetical protein Q9M28_10830 [Mariprofundaceae bacterium]|nr:hypothetical protein [Mariprofundaceae bacterium]